MRRAFAFWVAAVAAGAFETVLAVSRMIADGSGSGGEIAVGLVVRLGVFTGALLVAIRMRRGRGWARVALTIGLGVFGLASIVAEPLRDLATGESSLGDIADADAMDLLFGASRTLHVAAVLTAVTLMFLPAANAYFRTERARRSSLKSRLT
ncbi:hypothetical protein [Streptomyces avicenniae]|uniref:hypothetical protein n=1 Tax=Streptomyces avicenniae TaxID=500153 RepID=UPI00069C0D01|nr:hypothetical protein [Streptomyces avicenniae]